MQVWNVLHAARWKYRMQKGCKKSPSAHHRTTLSGCIFATKACIDNQKETFKQQYLLHMFSQYGELWPTNSWDRLASFGHPIKCQWVLHLGFVTAPTSPYGGQPNFAQCLVVSWAITLYTFLGALTPKRNFARCKIHFAPKSCVLLCWQRYCTALDQWASAKLCSVVSSHDRAPSRLTLGGRTV